MKLNYVVLNAENPGNLAQFYQETFGLAMSEDQGRYRLSAGDKLLLEIQAATSPRARTAGLYHLAFLLPTRQDLANTLRHLAIRQTEIDFTGASDHGYSEALYLNDPEGNGIEIYWDKPQSQWDIRPDGQIVGVIEPIDAEGLLAMAQEFQDFPAETKLGHVHLHIGDVMDAVSFYERTLGLSLKYIMQETAAFMAVGDYHHHLGLNIWQGQDIPAPAEGQAGLDRVVWQSEDLEGLATRLAAMNVLYDLSDSSLDFKDVSGIMLRVERAS